MLHVLEKHLSDVHVVLLQGNVLGMGVARVVKACDTAPRGVQPVLMRHPPSYLPKFTGGAGGRCARPTIATCITQGGVSVWGAWGYRGR